MTTAYSHEDEKGRRTANVAAPASDEIIKHILEADKAEERARLRATGIITASVAIAAGMAGMLGHESAIVSALVFGSVCLVSVSIFTKYLL